MELCSYEKEQIWYAPDFRDNREMPTESRFAVLLTPMSRRDLQHVQEVAVGKMTKGGKSNYMRRYHKVRDGLIGKYVLGVRNLTWTVKDTGESKPIETAADLLSIKAPVLDEILEDIFDALKDQSVLDEGIVGKSDSQSDTSG